MATTTIDQNRSLGRALRLLLHNTPNAHANGALMITVIRSPHKATVDLPRDVHVQVFVRSIQGALLQCEPQDSRKGPNLLLLLCVL